MAEKRNGLMLAMRKFQLQNNGATFTEGVLYETIRHSLKNVSLLLPTTKLGESTDELFLRLFNYIQDILLGFFGQECEALKVKLSWVWFWAPAFQHQPYNLEHVPKCFLVSANPSENSVIIVTSAKAIPLNGKQSDSTYMSFVI